MYPAKLGKILLKSVAFYRDQLGFTPIFEFGPYAGVKWGPISPDLAEPAST